MLQKIKTWVLMSLNTAPPLLTVSLSLPVRLPSFRNQPPCPCRRVRNADLDSQVCFFIWHARTFTSTVIFLPGLLLARLRCPLFPSLWVISHDTHFKTSIPLSMMFCLFSRPFPSCLPIYSSRNNSSALKFLDRVSVPSSPFS